MSTLYEGEQADDGRDGPVQRPTEDPGPQPGQLEPPRPATGEQADDHR